MATTTDFSKMVPGLDFLQGLLKGAGAALPGMGQWVAPTLDPKELERRIEELRTVQFWLEQNARLLATTIQALEVQRMTLSTLKNMNVPVDRMRDAWRIHTPDTADTPTGAAAPHAAQAPEAPAASARKRARRSAKATQPPPGESAGASPVDPMQWWNALTQQFTELAAGALKDSGAEAARNLAGQAVKAAVDLPLRAASAGVKAAGQVAAGAARKTAGRKR